jgi:ABC-type sugar transport system permease subunit
MGRFWDKLFVPKPALDTESGVKGLILEKKLVYVQKYKQFYLYILPLAGFVFLFTLWPVLKSIQVSFTDSYTALSNSPQYVGAANFITIFTRDRLFWGSFKITILATVIAVPINLTLACIWAAMLVSERIQRGRIFFRMAVFLPVVVPGIVGATIWRWIFNKDFGVVNQILGFLRMPPFGGVSDVNTVLIALLIIVTWKNIGFYTIIFTTNLQMIDKTQYEAADIEGAGLIRKFISITMPELRPAITINSVYALIQFLKIFEVPAVITRGGPNYKSNFLSYYAYSKFSSGQYGEATAMATVLFVVVLVLSVCAYVLSRREQ